MQPINRSSTGPILIKVKLMPRESASKKWSFFRIYIERAYYSTKWRVAC